MLLKVSQVAHSVSKVSVLVSMYRKNVDINYQRLVCRKITEGKLDSYVCMMIVCLVNNGKLNIGLKEITHTNFTICIVGTHIPSQKEHVQATTTDFPVEEKYQAAWDDGLELLGRPLSARLTSYANAQYLDIYYQ